MLEKIGLPMKPSLRGNVWVVDASHCQGCSSQFTFINRKHHCRRCGGIFCNSCTQQRMFLRGQGDSPVRICEPCKKLEEAARFEMRYGSRSRAAKGNSKSISKSENGSIHETLDDERKEASSSSITAQEASVDESSHVNSEGERGSVSPEDLRQKALEEKKKYKVLKSEGKSDEALKAFKRGKELERQADSLEISLRKSRRKALLSQNLEENQIHGESSRGNKAARTGKDKDDLASELKELGWSDMDLHNEDNKGRPVTLEGEFSSLLGQISVKSTDKGVSAIDKSQVLAHKKKALALKREGLLEEAKEELKKAKVLERRIEEEELLGAADTSDDELSTLINNMDSDKQESSSASHHQDHDFDLDFDPIDEGKFDVTDEDMEDPEIAAALKSFGWVEEESDSCENVVPQTVLPDKEALSNEILSLKREALSQKRAGNVSEAMSLLKKAKLLERDLGNFESQEENFTKEPTRVQNVSTHQAASKSSPSKSESDEISTAINDAPRKTKLAIQRELLGLKKKALALRREGRVDEAEEELKKGKILENQLEEMEKGPINAKAKSVPAQSKTPHLTHDNLPIADNEKEDVTDQDMNDPAYLSLLKNLGWKDENDDLPNAASGTHERSDIHPEQISGSVSQAEPVVPALKPRRSKAEMQRELLGLKRKALALRRQGESEEAEEILKKAKDLETQIADVEQSAKEVQIETSTQNENVEIDAEIVLENHIHDPSILSVHSVDTSVKKRSKGQIQRELLNLKRTALMHRRNGENEEAEEILRKAQVLEAQIEELEAPKMVQLQEVDHGLRDSDRHSPPVEDPIVPPHGNTTNLIDLLTGDEGFQQPLEKQEPVVLRDDVTYVARKDDFRTVTPEKIVHRDQEPRTEEANSTSESALQTKESALKQEIIARKREAVALKRAGKLAEAKEELRQAKLLEKRLSEDNANSKTIQSREPVSENDSKSKSSPAQDLMSENVPSETTIPKPISSRERFKLQQKSLAHKRQAMKLRREGKTQEAEAEFELAKALEAQLEESSPARDSSSSYGEGDVIVEDFLDPQLLSALKAIGIDDSVSIKSSKPEVSEGKSQNPETTSLEEQIKAEKLKALNLKRSGKQAEALEAFRRAKLLEKKLNSLS